MNYEKLPKTISAEELLSTPLPPVKWIIPGLLGRACVVCRPQQGGQKLADLVVVLADCAGQSSLESRNRAAYRDLFLVGRYI